MLSARPNEAVRSQTHDAYLKLRRDIISCRLPPGQKLNIGALRDAYGVSLGAIRESLSRLASEDLVLAKAQLGFRVAPVSAEDLVDLMRTRIEIESLCLRRSLAAGGLEWESSLIAAFHRLSRTSKNAGAGSPEVSDEWEAAHDASHLALVAACDSPWLLKIRAHLYTQAERYRRLSLRISSTRRNVAGEHRQLLKAAIARDVERTVSLMDKHLNTTTRFILEAKTLAFMAPSAAANTTYNGEETP